MERLQIKVYGLVQGVSYRYFVKKEAEYHGLVGTVKNLDDGTVKVVAEGVKNNLDLFLATISQGSDYSEIGNVETIWSKATGGFRDFRLIY